MSKEILSVMALILLSGCGQEDFNFETKIPLQEYTKDFQMQAAEEYDNLPSNSKLIVLVDDYGELRVLVRCSNNLRECESPK